MRSEQIHFETIGSTHTYAKANASTFNPLALTVIKADEQTKGRGRFNRKWITPKGASLAITYSFILPNFDHSVSPITLVLALSIVEALQKLGLIVKIKWPNDLYIHGQKIGGVLADVEPKEHGLQVVLSYGLNVNVTEEQFSQQTFKATSILIETKKKWSAQALSESIEKTFKRDLELFITTGFSSFHSSFEEISFFHGKIVRLNIGHKVIVGEYAGVNKEGALLLKLKNSEIKSFVSGEIIGWE